MLRPVDRSMTVSAPQRIAHTIFSTSSSIEEETAELPILALIFTRKLRPIAIGSSSPWLMLAGMMARPQRDLLAHELRRDELRQRGAEALAVGQPLLGDLERELAAEILALGDIDHLLGDDAGARPFVLRDRLARQAAQRPRRVGERQQRRRLHVAVVDRLDRPAVIFLDAAALEHPGAARARQALATSIATAGIGVGAGRVVDPHSRFGGRAELRSRAGAR